MGAWGIMMRDSDDGFEMLDTIVVEQLRKVDFAAFNVSEALLLLNQNTQDEIEKCKKKPPSKMTEFYISESLLHNFARAALLVAECLDDYYRTGELMVYDYVGENYDVELMAETCASRREYIRVNGEDVPIELVRRRFLKLDGEHIRYVMDSLRQNTTQVVNIRAYTLAALYNAPVTISQYYTAQVSHDMAQGFGGA